mmetsp:Transcript_94959/g.307161  ORF Transcript_94959/g.307161 Transcript_94959/m.307161 type:complete len:461 (+) Transcript_94959:452-1834(+)
MRQRDKGRVSIRAAEAERGETQRGSIRDEAVRSCRHNGLELLELDVRVQTRKVQIRRALQILQGQQALRQPTSAGGPLEVADARLHRAEHQLGAPALAQHVPQGAGLDRVAERRARAVAFHTTQRRTREPRLQQGGQDDPLLRRAVGCGQRRATAVLVDGQTLHPGMRAADGVERRGLEEEGATPLSSGEAVGRGIEGAAAARLRQQPGLRKGDKGLSDQVQLRACAEGGGRRAGPQPSESHLCGDEGRGASCIDAGAEALESKDVRDPVRSDRRVRSRAGVRSGLALGRGLRPVRIALPHEHCDLGIAQHLAGAAGGVECSIRDLEAVPLLRIDDFGLHGGHSEKLGVEELCTLHEGPMLGIGLGTLGLGVGVEGLVEVEAPQRDLHNGVAASGPVGPTALGAVSPREAAGKTHSLPSATCGPSDARGVLVNDPCWWPCWRQLCLNKAGHGTYCRVVED